MAFNLIKEHLLDNPHRVQLTLVPDATKSAKEAADEKARLAEIGKNLTEEQKLKLLPRLKH